MTDDRENTTNAEPTEELTTAEPTEEPTTEEPTTEDIPTVEPLPETEQVFAEVRYPVYNRYSGSGEYEIGYSVDETGQSVGPDSFAIEGKNVAILDEVNHRIYYYSENYYSRRHISLENLKFSGERLYVNRITSVSDREVVFDGSRGSATLQFRYEKSDGLPKSIGIAPNEQRIKIGDQIATVIGKVGDRMYYQYRTGEGQDAKNIIGMEVENVGRWYVTQELSGYHSVPADNLYVSQDGKLYLMECFDDQTVICELKLGEPEEEPTEDSTKEATPYDGVLDEYFAKREAIYTSTEKPEIDPGYWEIMQRYMSRLGWNVLTAEMSYLITEVISETETEVKLHLIEIAQITYTLDGYVQQYRKTMSLEHIIRLSKQDGTYQIVADSCYDKNQGYQSGLEEDIKLLKSSSGSVAG